MTSTAYIYNSATGLIIPDTSATLAEVQGEYQAAFGNNLIVTPDTPQGVLITTETIARNNFLNNNAAVSNQINPNYSVGIFLDAIMALTGIQRTIATPTAVAAVTVTGVAGTTIPAGSQAQTGAGDIFQTTATVVIPSGGTTTVNFQSVALGPIPCTSSALNTIITAVLGWETVSNSNAGTLGSSTQSDQAARAFRQNTLFFQGKSLIGAITSALYNVAGVTSLSALENYNNVPMGALISVIGGATLSGTIWGMTNTGTVTVGTTSIVFVESEQDLPTINPWPLAAFTTTGNITLSGLATQGGGDWPSSLTAAQIILVKNQTTTTQNGIYLAESSTWTRQAYLPTSGVVLGSNQGISMIPNSIYTCIAGGVSTAIAAALLENKSSGCGWNGNTTVNIIEPSSGQTYPVQFDTPNEIAILINATVSGCTAAAATQAILDYAAGNLTRFDGFVVGQDVSPFELAGAIMGENPGAYVSLVEVAVSSESPSFSTSPIAIALNQQAQTQFSYITITVN